MRIQNNVFKFDKSQWTFNEEEEAPIYQQNIWRHTVVVIDENFYHYDCHEEKLSKCPITYLVGKYKDGKYMIIVVKVYQIKPKL